MEVVIALVPFLRLVKWGANGLQYDLAESVFVTGFLIVINFLNRHFIFLLQKLWMRLYAKIFVIKTMKLI
ncbi:hypothetical protein EPM78_06495 [Neisseria gonorrhoeae]|uniref:Uncharacterized protein n=2 Tax=Neisseria gonorrhoeae TaxID=485 RepID=A0A0H4IS79_NEIG1|nr:hypothetical protein NGO_09385 [Neisseria gonorrhoeae FA 1090]ARB97923.1 hypothetical protein A6J43_00515 [Neisseria gonorrhoeae]KLS69340.1 hypothetical protein M741_02420 [Neisseria gonorrhoeae NOR_2011_03-06]KLS78933.1 hypothetical protein M771_07670 [Neisseria gonorrhoeae MU_NG1]KLS82437.1 hypothetical protein M786_10315 [Neisseria gonorrhoeae MU_NG21]KLS88788.1 hypothetical protein M775_05575 [Neisseria gonorrhoeae MU_NG6]